MITYYAFINSDGELCLGKLRHNGRFLWFWNVTVPLCNYISRVMVTLPKWLELPNELMKIGGEWDTELHPIVLETLERELKHVGL